MATMLVGTQAKLKQEIRQWESTYMVENNGELPCLDEYPTIIIDKMMDKAMTEKQMRRWKLYYHDNY